MLVSNSVPGSFVLLLVLVSFEPIVFCRMDQSGHSGKLERVGRVGLPNESMALPEGKRSSLEDRLLAVYEVWLV